MIGVYGLVFAACSGFNPNNRFVQFVDGEAYYIPYSVNFWYPKQQAKELVELRSNLNCDKNSIVWIDESLEISNANQLTADILQTSIEQGKIGCSNVLSQSQLQYIQHLENLRQQREMQLQQLNAQFQQQQQQIQQQSFQQIQQSNQAMQNLIQQQQQQRNFDELNRNLNRLNSNIGYGIIKNR